MQAESLEEVEAVEAEPEGAAPAENRNAEESPAVVLDAAEEPTPTRRSSRGRERVELTGDVAESAAAWLEKLFDLASLDLTAELYEGEGRFEVDLSGPDSSLVVEDEAQVLRSIQHLLPRLMHADIGRLLHCRVDCDSYQQEREEELQELAERTASDVVDRGRSKTLPPMHPADRRVVHLALADDPDVETESVGTGYFKRVQVRLL